MSARYKFILSISLCINLYGCSSDDKSRLPDAFSSNIKSRTNKELSTHFTTKAKKPKQKQALKSPFSKKVTKAIERSDLRDHFTKPSSTKPISTLSDAFLRTSEKKERAALQDHFTTNKKQGVRANLDDHFASNKKNIVHKESDLHSKGAQRKLFRKNFQGERFRLFNKDPNSSRGKRKAFRNKSRKKDPFSRNKRKLDTPQGPKGEGDLFPNGVMPKMDDPR